MKTGTTNQQLKALIEKLKEESHSQGAKIWKRIAGDLEKSSRNRRVVNISRLNLHTKENETVVVPGKVLGSGKIAHSLVVAAFAFSHSAKEQIEKAKGKCISINELLKQNPKGQKLRIIG